MLPKKFKLYAGLSTIMLIGLALFQNAANKPALGPGFDIIVIAGQSNAAGGGVGQPAETAADRIFDDRIVQLGRFGDRALKVVPAEHGLDHLFSNLDEARKYTGFGLTFARSYVRDYLPAGRKVLLVPVAKGGSSILYWNDQPDFPDNPLEMAYDDQNWPASNPVNLYALYRDMKNRVIYALSLAPDGTYATSPAQANNRIVAFMWQQGEADIYASAYKNDAYAAGVHSLMTDEEIYRQRLLKLFSQIRTDFGTQGFFPILLGSPAPDWQVPHVLADGSIDQEKPERKLRFQEAMKAAARRIVNASYVEATADMHSNPADSPGGDNQFIHYNTISQLMLGQRYFTEYATMYPHLSDWHAGFAKILDRFSPAELSSAVSPTENAQQAIGLLNGRSCSSIYMDWVDTNPTFRALIASGSDDDFLNALFNKLLRRGPNNQELTTWRAILTNGGNDRYETTRLFLTSPELARLCQREGLE